LEVLLQLYIKNSHAISNVNVQFMSNISETILSLSLGLVTCNVAAHCIYTQSEFKKLGVLSVSQLAWGNAGWVISVIVVYMPKPGLSTMSNDFRHIPHQLTSLGCNQTMMTFSAKQSTQPVTLASN